MLNIFFKKHFNVDLEALGFNFKLGQEDEEGGAEEGGQPLDGEENDEKLQEGEEDAL